MAEEFKTLPTYLQHASSMLVHNKQHRTIFICSVISLMALTSIVGVLACPTSIRRYSEALELQQQPLVNPTLQPERLVAPTDVSLDQFILTFLEAALHDESSSDEQKDVSSKENQTASRGSDNMVDAELTKILADNRADPEKGRRRKEFFRFCRHEQTIYKLAFGRRYRRFARNRRDEDMVLRKVPSTPETEPRAESMYMLDYVGDDVGLEITCVRPEYIVFTWILCLIALASALKLYYLVKTALATIIVAVYAVLILVVCKDFFSIPDEEKDS